MEPIKIKSISGDSHLLDELFASSPDLYLILIDLLNESNERRVIEVSQFWKNENIFTGFMNLCDEYDSDIIRVIDNNNVLSGNYWFITNNDNGEWFSIHVLDAIIMVRENQIDKLDVLPDWLINKLLSKYVKSNCESSEF